MIRCFAKMLAAGFCLLAALALCSPVEADSIICWPDAAADNTGSVYGPTPLSNEIVAWRTPRSDYSQNYYHEVGYARFNISAVPDTGLISAVTAHFYVNDFSGHAQFRLVPLEFDPLVTSDLWIRWDITTDTRYEKFATCTDIAGSGWYVVDLGVRGVEYLTSMLDEDWFGMGFRNLVSGVRVDGWADPNPPYLVVNENVDPVTIHVDDDGLFDPGPGDPTLSDPDEDGSLVHPFDSIQKAIDVVEWKWFGDPDKVLVADGTYTGAGNRDIAFNGKRAHVVSANGPENCIIDCQGSSLKPHRGFLVQGEGADTVIEGLTIRGGYEAYGGAIVVGYNSSPVIRENRIIDNEATIAGGGIWLSSGTITGNRISGNTAVTGGGIFVPSNAEGSITNNLIHDNTASGDGGGLYTEGRYLDVVNNAIFGNQAANGGGIYRDGWSSRYITCCTVTGNTATSGGGGLYLDWNTTIVDCVIRNNGATTGDDIYFDWGTHSIHYSNTGNAEGDIYQDPGATVNWGEGIIHANPEYTPGAGGDYYLSQLSAGQPLNSVCVDAGSGPASDIQVPLSWDTTTGATTWMLMSERTTATNFEADTGTVDMGFHYPALPTVTGQLDMTPSVGMLPFGTRISTTLTNNYTDQSRRMAARIDVTLAGGNFFPNWRAGWTNIAAGLNYTASWMQTIPAYSTLNGENRFTLHTWDVTPTPYNQPPYPAAGNSDSDTRVVVGIAP